MPYTSGFQPLLQTRSPQQPQLQQLFRLAQINDIGKMEEAEQTEEKDNKDLHYNCFMEVFVVVKLSVHLMFRILGENWCIF